MAQDDELLSVEITPEVKSMLEREARLRGMDESSVAAKLLIEYLKAVGRGEGGGHDDGVVRSQ
jgi:hypothetical protein